MASEEVIYDGLNLTFLAAFPEFNDACKREFDYWDDWNDPPGIYLILAMVVFPRLVSLLDTGEEQELTWRLFEFFEKMACSTERSVKDVLGIEVVDKLVHDPVRLQKAWPHMGNEMKAVTKGAAKTFGIQIEL